MPEREAIEKGMPAVEDSSAPMVQVLPTVPWNPPMRPVSEKFKFSLARRVRFGM